MYSAYIGTLQNVHKHSNADRLLVGEIFGNQVIVGLDYKEGETLVYFPEGGRLNKDFCAANNLLRSQNGYIDDHNCRVRAQKLRGEVSDGLPLRLEALSNFVGIDNTKDLKVGDRFDIIAGIKICEKYVAPATRIASQNNRKGARKCGETIWFSKHFDTDQLSYNLHKIKVGDILIISDKQHGTSARFGHVLDEVELPRWKRFINKLYPVFPTKEYRYLNGTRNVILDESKKAGAMHGSGIRDSVEATFKGKLNKGEIVYCEILGYEDLNKPIMGAHNTSKINDKKFAKQYGDSMIYSYGCKNGEHRITIYRISVVNEDGISYDLSWDGVKARAAEMGVLTVPECERLIFDGDYDALMEKVKFWGDREDECGTHWSEGVCVRVDNSVKLNILKWKCDRFKILENLIKDDENYVDTEESS